MTIANAISTNESAFRAHESAFICVEGYILLSGMKVVSFCHFLQGPAAMQYLADMGASVIKIEPPTGAFERHWSGADRAKIGGVSAFFLCANRNVRSLAIDLKHPEAKAVVFRLIDQSNVVAENFRPAALDRLGFGYEAVVKRKPDIIYASASGFGATGPYSGRPGQDLLIQAMSGLAVANGTGVDPSAIGFAAVDQHGAALLALGIAGAYAKWLRTGEGTRVEATLLGAGLDLQAESLVTYHASKIGKNALVRDHRLATWYHDAPYGIYQARDCHFALSLSNCSAVADALGSDALRSLADQNAFSGRDEIARAIADDVKNKSFSELSHTFDSKGIWFARVDDYDELLENPQIVHNGAFISANVNGEPLKLVSHPLRYDGVVPRGVEFALEPGADTCTILEEARFTNDEITDLLRNKVAFTSDARSAQ